MTPDREIIVTLSEELAGHLHGLATALEVPFEWLVAGIVCDTIERSRRDRACNHRSALAS
jgi:hypothetical protein